jgi:hypothetical protein
LEISERADVSAETKVTYAAALATSKSMLFAGRVIARHGPESQFGRQRPLASMIVNPTS